MTPDLGDAGDDDADVPSGSDLDADGASDLDGGQAEGFDAQVEAGVAGDGGVARDGSDDTDASTPCSGEQRSWYPDGDGDDYGRDEGAVTACAKPSGSWAQRGGDCHDGEVDVHPGQPRYFGEPYESVEGLSSFDYDCSGSEDESGTQTKLVSCGLLDVIACQGRGYEPTKRAGLGRNDACGSTVIQTCVAVVIGVLVCDAVRNNADQPFVCR